MLDIKLGRVLGGDYVNTYTGDEGGRYPTTTKRRTAGGVGKQIPLKEMAIGREGDDGLRKRKTGTYKNWRDI